MCDTTTDVEPDDTTAQDVTEVTEVTDDQEQQQPEEPDTFPRSHVKQLRQENGKYRQRAQRADEYAERLHVELVRATGRLADPTDLAFDDQHLDDPDALAAAVDELVSRKPHLASRRPIGEIGQGASTGDRGHPTKAAGTQHRLLEHVDQRHHTPVGCVPPA